MSESAILADYRHLNRVQVQIPILIRYHIPGSGKLHFFLFPFCGPTGPKKKTPGRAGGTLRTLSAYTYKNILLSFSCIVIKVS